MQQEQQTRLIDLTAMGDPAAQRAMVNECLTEQLAGTFTPFEGYAYAEVFARQAAAHGSLSDRLYLSAILRVRALHIAEIGDPERGLALHEEAEQLCRDLDGLTLNDGLQFLVAVLTSQAENGVTEAGLTLDRITAALSPADAAALRDNINTAKRQVSAATAEA